MTDGVERLAMLMADYLEEHADDIVERWIDGLQQSTDTRAISGLPRAAIRNHIPPVLRSIAAYLRSPIDAVRGEMLGHLELHARLRRAQGYKLHELLTEFDALARLVSMKLQERLSGAEPSPSVADTIGAFERLSTGLRAIGFVTVDLFREAEADDRQRVAERLEEFSRTIAHELRTPLQTASLALELLRQTNGPDDAEQREYHIAAVEASLERTADLVDNLRQLALVEAGLSRPNSFGRARLLVQETIEQIGPLAGDRDVEVRLEGEVPDVSVDRVVFQLALVNVLGNAIKYSDPGKRSRWVEVTARLKPVEADLDLLVVAVQDNGLGIANEYVRRVFQRHVRANPEAAEGTGLGLSISQQLLAERGGDIELTSELGEGTTVTFELPSHPGEVAGPPTIANHLHAVAQVVQGVRADDDDVDDDDDDGDDDSAASSDED